MRLIEQDSEGSSGERKPQPDEYCKKLVKAIKADPLLAQIKEKGCTVSKPKPKDADEVPPPSFYQECPVDTFCICLKGEDGESLCQPEQGGPLCQPGAPSPSNSPGQRKKDKDAAKKQLDALEKMTDVLGKKFSFEPKEYPN